MDEVKQMDEIKQKKKKHTHLFELYLNKIIKTASQSNSISLNAKQQLSSYICSFIFGLTEIACKLALVSKKKTLSTKEFSNALHLLLEGNLLDLSIKEGLTSINKYQHSKETLTTSTSRQVRSGIIFPPSLVDKLIRKKLNNKLVLSSLTPIFLASICEFISYEILDLSIFVCKKNRRSRITVTDIITAVENDIELSAFYNKLNVSFLDGGIVSEAFSLFNENKNNKKQIALCLRKLPFRNLVKLSLHKNMTEGTQNMSKMSYTVLQYFIEQYIIKLFLQAKYLTTHAGRKKMTPNDILLVNYFITHKKNIADCDFELLSL
jgi:histone H3/H4